MIRIVSAMLSAVVVTACASNPDAPSGPPTLVIDAGQPAPPQARFYADCIVQAANANTYDREANVIRFRCDGNVARRFYDGLGPWSTEIGSQIEDDNRVWRFSSVIRENPSFVDFCWRETDRYGCTVVLNVGEFLDR